MIEPVGLIWKCGRYETNNGAVGPCPGSQPKEYDVWRFHRQAQKDRWVLIMPYGELLEVARVLKLSPPSSRLTSGGNSEWQLSDRVATDVIAWCKAYGLLGILPLSFELLADNLQLSFRDALLNESCDGRWPKTKAALAAAFSVGLRDLRPYGSSWIQLDSPQNTSDVVTWTVLEKKKYRERLSNRFFSTALDNAYCPSKAEYWSKYSEPIELFALFAWRFLEAVASVAGIKELVNHDSELADPHVALSYLMLLANRTAVSFELDATAKHWRQVHVAPSLLSQLAAMFLADWQSGRRVGQCQRCGAVFVSDDSRAKYCSIRCRKTILMRNYRARALQEKDSDTPSGSPSERQANSR